MLNSEILYQLLSIGGAIFVVCVLIFALAFAVAVVRTHEDESL